MTDADELRARVDNIVEKLRELSIVLINAKSTIGDLQAEILVLDIMNPRNMHTASATRSISQAGRGISEDEEILLSVQSELVQWGNSL